MGTRMMVDMPQATRAIAEDALAGVSLLLPAPRCAQCQLPVPAPSAIPDQFGVSSSEQGLGGGSRSRQGP